ncbi:MAG: RAMP superfamily CRISPR-associated protein [Pseudonocardiaceae bacterium]
MTDIRTEPAPTFDAVLADFAGVGGFRPVHAVWQFVCVLTIRSDLRIGGSDDDEPVDLVLHRDPDTGRVELRGSTVAGVLRHELDHRLQGYPAQHPNARLGEPNRTEHQDVRALFGGAEEEDTSSPLTVFDATVEEPSANTEKTAGRIPAVPGRRPQTQLRSGVTLDPGRAVARTGALFTSEALLAGARFVVSFELVIDHAGRELGLLRQLVSAADGLRVGGVRFGRRTATGNGVVHADRWVARRLDPSTDQGWQHWRVPTYPERRATDREDTATSSHDLLADAVRAAWSGDPLDLTPHPDQRDTAIFQATLTLRRPVTAGATIDGTLLIRDRPTDLSGEHPPDHAHRFNAEGAVVQGSSLFDAMRAAGRRVLSALAGPCSCTPEASCPACRARNRVLTGLWGSEPEPGVASPRAGRVAITEPVLVGATRARITRIRLERLDGHVTEGHLVCDEVAVGGAGGVTLTVAAPTAADRALLTHVLLDLHEGLATVGGAIGAGHGQLRLADDTLTIDGRGWTVQQLRASVSPLRAWSTELACALVPTKEDTR